jgi:hypothetical protein
MASRLIGLAVLVWGSPAMANAFSPAVNDQAGGSTGPGPEQIPGEFPAAVFGIGSVYIPINGGDFAVVVQLGVVFPRSEWDFRVLLDGYQAFDRDTLVRGVLLSVRATRWWDSYGFGAGIGAGYANFVNRTGGGWSGPALSAEGYLVPVSLRIGGAPRFEFSLQTGLVDYVLRDMKPYFYLSVTLVL